MGLSITHLLVVAVIVLLLFGGNRLADLGKGLGAGIRNFKHGLEDDDLDGKKTSSDTALAESSK